MAFENFLNQDKSRPKKGRRITATASIAFHGVLLAIGVVYSFWHVDELSPPTVTVTFLSAAPPPPPPPPPKKKSSATKVKPKVPVEIVQPKPDQVVQPKEEPKEEEKDEDDDGEENGVEGGVKGGTVGGVVGGVVGSTGTGPVEQAPMKVLPPSVMASQLAIDPSDAAYAVQLPPVLSKPGMSYAALVKLTVSKEGTVTDLKILGNVDPLLAPLIAQKLRTWRFRPYAVNGHPVPFQITYRYILTAHN